jgi:hypothetical protein
MGTTATAAIAFISRSIQDVIIAKRNVPVDQQKAYAVTKTVLRRWSREGKKNGIFQCKKNVCILRESNPSQLLGRQLSYRWTKNALMKIDFQSIKISR